MKTETPVEKLIREFEELKEKASSIKDKLYLDGVLAVLETNRTYEREIIEKAFMEGQKNAGKWITPSSNNLPMYKNISLTFAIFIGSCSIFIYFVCYFFLSFPISHR